jgi:hypothetical protein
MYIVYNIREVSKFGLAQLIQMLDEWGLVGSAKIKIDLRQKSCRSQKPFINNLKISITYYSMYIVYNTPGAVKQCQNIVT